MIGKKVKCPGCGTIFVAKAADDDEPEPPKPAKSPAKPARPSQAIGTSPRSKQPAREEDEEEEDRPRRKSRVDDDEEEEEEKPRRKSRRDEDDDEDEEDDQPRRRSRRDEEDDEDEDDDDRPRRQSQEEEDDFEEEEDEGDDDPRVGWRKVRKGITLILIALFARIALGILLAIVGMIGAAGVASSIGPRGNVAGALNAMGTFAIIMVVLQKLVQYTCQGTDVFGHFLNMSPPDRRGISLKTLGLVTFVFAASGLGCALLYDVVSFFLFGFGAMGGNPIATLQVMQNAGYAVLAIGILLAVAWVGTITSFLLQLRGICQAWGKESLARQVYAYLITFGSLVGAAILVYGIGFLLVGAVIWSALGSGGGPIGETQRQVAGTGVLVISAFSCLLAVAALGMFVWYIIILFLVRGTVDSGLRRR
jgi:hypothetical protein